MAQLDLGPFDELPQVRTYATLLLAFPLPDMTRQPDIERHLQAATDQLVRSFPFLGGYITVSEASETQSNANKHVPGDPIKRLKVTVNDVPKDFPSYHEIISAKAPAAMLDGSILGQGIGFPDKITGATLSPCLGIRANFLEGGLLLTIALMHAVGDGNSLGQVVKMFASLCRGEELAGAVVEAGNADRQPSIPSLEAGDCLMDHDDMFVKVPTGQHQTISKDDSHLKEAPAMRWSYFRISKEKLAHLKAEASSDQFLEPSTFISSNDAFSALIWRSITLGRLPRLEPNGSTTLMRAVNARRKLDPPLPEATLQNVIAATYTPLDIQDLSTTSLATITMKLRKDVLAIDDYQVRSMATFVRSIKDKSRISYGANLTPNDILISSFADLPIYTSDFGPLLGKPHIVRRPTLTPTDGLIYIMPKSPDGSLDAAVSIRVDDMERMCRDEKWSYYTEYIG